MQITKENYIRNLVQVYEDLLNQSIKMVNRAWDTIETGMLDTDFHVYLGSDEDIRRDFEEQYVMTIIGALNMASVRTGLGVRNSPNNTYVNVVEFMLNDEKHKEA